MNTALPLRSMWLDRCARAAAAALLALAALLTGCAVSPPRPEAASVEPAGGRILGRSERFVIYDPAADDTLASLALRFLGSAKQFWTIADFNEIDHLALGQPIVVPLVPINPLGVRVGEIQTVTILCYHRFGASRTKMMVTPSQFEAQLDWLEHNDYRVIPMKQLVGFLAGKEGLPKRAVVITIDDGHESGYTFAVPLLRKHGFPATFFIYTDYIGSGGALTWPQIKELSASDEFEIGAHSKTHRNLAVRNAGEADVAYRKNLSIEVQAPVELLARQLQARIGLFAYPYGDTNDIVLGLLAKDRIDLAGTVTPGGNAFFAAPFLLHRTMIFGDQDIEAFKAKLQTTRRFGPS